MCGLMDGMSACWSVRFDEGQTFLYELVKVLATAQ